MKYIRAFIKMILFFASSFGLYGVWFIADFIIPNKQYWRQLIFRTWGRWFVRIAGMEVEVIGEKPKPPFFLVSNHLGYADIPVLRSVIESVFVAKADIESWFLAGKIVRDMGMIYIDRENRRDIPRAGEDILETLRGGEGVIIFPEGTSTNGETVLPFNSSFFEFAAKTDLPIHYASITYQIEDGEEKASDVICWWDDISFIEHLWGFFQLKGCKAIITFGCEAVAKPNRKELAKELWDRVNEKFIPVI
jgi:1-acyl-sn-glycerol-3-phosphate acyltransferase